jgi:hypothetical protein
MGCMYRKITIAGKHNPGTTGLLIKILGCLAALRKSANTPRYPSFGAWRSLVAHLLWERVSALIYTNANKPIEPYTAQFG